MRWLFNYLLRIDVYNSVRVISAHGPIQILQGEWRRVEHSLFDRTDNFFDKPGCF